MRIARHVGRRHLGNGLRRKFRDRRLRGRGPDRCPDSSLDGDRRNKGQDCWNGVHRHLDRHSRIANSQWISGGLVGLALCLYRVGRTRFRCEPAHPRCSSKPARQASRQLWRPHGIDALTVLPVCETPKTFLARRSDLRRLLFILDHADISPEHGTVFIRQQPD